jgi:glycosyltransferase involved in cell wall biosynthesis
LISRKRLDLVLDVLCRLDLPELALRVVGDETRDAQAARLLRARGAPRTTLLGTLSDAALADELARADVLILASTLEGYGMVLTEACHAGLPAIVARSAALPEVALSERHVIVFDDAPDLERALRRFAGDPALRASLSAAARERAPSLPRWADTQAKFRELLGGLMRGRLASHVPSAS